MSEVLIAQPHPKVEEETPVNIKYFMPNGDIIEMNNLMMPNARRQCRSLRKKQLEQYQEQLVEVKNKRI